ncbi:hypothetical protein TIFTF001_025627 [Ficus carica]|uniref:Disease resistance RPP13-like protein 1 n=1 Tax=Ficus carica TaxID=3494 RepID=A0AA88B1I4_FICCA|nr:hypothetical protein TIFTF001_025627 [Ficus carica]
MKSTTPNMAELVSEPYLSAVFEKLFESLSSGELVNFFRGKKSLHEQLRKLNEKLSIARSMLYDAEERQISQPDVKEWLDELKHVVLKADDLVEDINDEARSKRERESGSRISMLLKSFFSSFTEFDRTVQGETTQILNDLDDLLDKTVDLGLKYGSVARKTGSLTRLPSRLQGEESHVYGRSVEIEEILRLLLADEVWGNGIGVLPIVGVGGLGKTTIAQAVFDDDRVKKHAFQLKAWVTVSTDFDISMTAKAILQQVNSKNTRDTEEPAKLQLQLKEAMRGKKILCVLDDIWEANYQHWDFLLSAFTCADRRSRIIVTTRSENVASIVKTGETLLLSNCIRLTRLPTNMGRLINLRHLDTTSSPLEEMPPQMCNLEQLQKLSDFVLSEFSGPSIKELGYLQYLGGKLRISGLQNVDNVDDVLKANLREKANLYELSLQWRGDPDDTRRGREVLDALQPHPNLKKLTIYKFAGSSFPEWVGDSLFSNLVSLHLNGSEYCFLLPPVGQLPSLQELSVKSFNGVETIGDEFYGSNSSITPFQSLESLSFDGMPKWHEWLFTGDDKEVGCFPRLKKLQLYGCPNLTGSLPDCDSTETLEIGWCNKLDFPGSYHYASLKKLRIEGLDSLKSLPLDYFPKLEKLVLEECQNLESLTFSEETGTALESLSFLRLVVCKNFRSLPKNMHRHLPSLAYMEMSICPKISSFPKGGLPSKLNELVLFNCRKLVAQHKHWDLQGVTSLRSLYVSDCNVVLDSFPEGLLPSSLTSLELCSLPHLKNLNGSAFRHVASLHKLSLVRCGELQFLPEEVLPISLRWLRIHKCPFLEQYWRGKGISHIPNIKAKMAWGFSLGTTRFFELKVPLAVFPFCFGGLDIICTIEFHLGLEESSAGVDRSHSCCLSHEHEAPGPHRTVHLANSEVWMRSIAVCDRDCKALLDALA